MAYVITFPNNYLDIGGVPLSTPAWEVTNLQRILSGPEVRGEPTILPGAIGARANPVRATVWNLTLELYLCGDKDAEGTPFADAHEGLITNVDTLRELVTDPITADRGTRLATWHRPGALADLTATVQVRRLEIGDRYNPSEVPATLDLMIMTGMFQ